MASNSSFLLPVISPYFSQVINCSQQWYQYGVVPFSFLFSLYFLAITSFSSMKKSYWLWLHAKCPSNKSLKFKHCLLTVAYSTARLGTLLQFAVSASQLCQQPFEPFKINKLQCKVHSKKHSNKGSDRKKARDQAENLLSNFLAGAEGPFSGVKERRPTDKLPQKSHQLGCSHLVLGKTSRSKKQVAWISLSWLNVN